MTLEVPRVLPVRHLSASSINLYLRCPLKWKHRYIDALLEPSNGPMLVGKAVGAAEGQSFTDKIETGVDLELPDVLDAYSDEFDLAVEAATDREGVDWNDRKVGNVKDEGTGVLDVYHRTVAPRVIPVTVEREFELQPPGVDWKIIGFMDVETEDNLVVDLKVKGKALSKAEAHRDLQATMYLLARREEARAGYGIRAEGFEFHVMKKLKTPAIDLIGTTRTDAQLDAFYERVLGIAAEIAWRTETGMWQGAVPGSWWCSEQWCNYWKTCPMGGKA